MVGCYTASVCSADILTQFLKLDSFNNFRLDFSITSVGGLWCWITGCGKGDQGEAILWSAITSRMVDMRAVPFTLSILVGIIDLKENLFSNLLAIQNIN